MTEATNLQAMTDGRSRLRKWWDRKTIAPVQGTDLEDAMVAHVRCRFGWAGRILLLLGRDVEVRIWLRSPNGHVEAESIAQRAAEIFHAQGRHVPRKR